MMKLMAFPGRRLAIAAAILLGSCGSLRAQEATWSAPDWLMTGSYTPEFVVRDTDNKYGRYDDALKVVTLEDLIRFHGHFCGGLVEASGALRVAFDRLFPDGIIDRTDLRVAAKNSACGGDVAAYLTGARTHFGTYMIDQLLTESEFVVQQVSTGRSVRVRVRPEAYPNEVRTQMRKIESGEFTPADIDLFQTLQWDYAKRIVSRPLEETFVLVEDQPYAWPRPACSDFGTRTDNDYKAVPVQ